MPARPPITVLVADEHPLVIAGVRATLADQADIEIVGEARALGELLALIERRSPDVVLMDLQGTNGAGPAALTTIAQHHPAVKTVVLSARADRGAIDAALLAGAAAYVLKTAEAADVAALLRQAASGAVFHTPSAQPAAAASPGLTERERSILAAVASGQTTAVIAREMFISEHTIKFHLTNIYRKLEVRNRAGAVRYALQHGLS